MSISSFVASLLIPAAFNTTPLEIPVNIAWPWLDAQQKIRKEISLYEACDRDRGQCVNENVAEWRDFIRSMKPEQTIKKLERVNAFFNARTWQDDRVRYGVKDHWASPIEFLAGTGDCEDYVIAKYTSLIELGFSPESLQVLILSPKNDDQAHAVLGVRVGKDLHILDNLASGLQSPEDYADRQLMFSMTAKKLWKHRPEIGDVSPTASTR